MSIGELHDAVDPAPEQGNGDLQPQAMTSRSQEPPADKRLNRLHVVRKQQGLSVRTAARHLRVDIRELRRQEQPSTDLTLSELYAWQKVLDVPIADLLVDPGTPLSRPVLERARLVKLMKTVLAIGEESESQQVQKLVQGMVELLVEVMPELEHIGPWPSMGRQRSMDEQGQAAERCISEEFLFRHFPE